MGRAIRSEFALPSHSCADYYIQLQETTKGTTSDVRHIYTYLLPSTNNNVVVDF